MLRGIFSTNDWMNPNISVMGPEVVKLMLQQYDLVVDEQTPPAVTSNDELVCQLTTGRLGPILRLNRALRGACFVTKYRGLTSIQIEAPFEEIRFILEREEVELTKYEAKMVHELQTTS